MAKYSRDELAEMAAADEEIERTFKMTAAEYALSVELDLTAKRQARTPEQEARCEEYSRYYQANRDKLRERKKKQYLEKREEILARQKRYRETHREYLRERARIRYDIKKQEREEKEP